MRHKASTTSGSTRRVPAQSPGRRTSVSRPRAARHIGASERERVSGCFPPPLGRTQGERSALPCRRRVGRASAGRRGRGSGVDVHVLLIARRHLRGRPCVSGHKELGLLLALDAVNVEMLCPVHILHSDLLHKARWLAARPRADNTTTTKVETGRIVLTAAHNIKNTERVAPCKGWNQHKTRSNASSREEQAQRRPQPLDHMGPGPVGLRVEQWARRRRGVCGQGGHRTKKWEPA